MPNPDNIQLYYEQSLQAYQSGQPEAALAFIERVLQHDLRNCDALHLCGLIALAQHDIAQAENWFMQAVNVKPHPIYYNSLCVAQTRMSAFARAAASARAGLAMHGECSPADTATLLYNLGIALQADDRLQEAVAVYRLALSLNPLHSEARNNLSTCLNAFGDLNGAIDELREAITLNPGNFAAHSNLGHSLLAAGCFSEGWRYYEHRWAVYDAGDGAIGIEPPDLPIGRWLGQAPAAGDRLLVLNEQGLGDTLQFCRYLLIAASRFAEVGFVCPPPLRRLLTDSLCSRNPNLTLLHEMPADVQQWDWYCPLLSLPMAFDTQLDSIPATLPYLYANSHASRQWETRIATLQSGKLPRIGVVWAGGHSGTVVDRRRSVPVEALASLLEWPHAHWFSLQKAESEDKQLPDPQRLKVIDWMDEVEDFADTAALVDTLDLVISVDTSVAHLAAAMGKPVWLLNRFAGCWRWLRERDGSPWYPGMRIFTQRERGDWPEVLQRVLSTLQGEYAPGAR
ncbi:MAG TPA: tetratricopeptide repeat-containing glycosyltransferase family protein [Paraburkholderia sp.]|jgi:tetratricopeptide (TPR) repeat protein|uniref:tetratricopeptide repeat-containing glycosyltransferase family protein n=1 Tax=Paraburkholderia sp. TaxID=1926495 RepID=UPI002DE9F752|nr:tetratricopeptide repeat-containing glycosyltransferase family protein [Paraburkholderia sp.]